MDALAGERIEEARRIADEQPAPSGPTRHPVTERPGAGQLVGRRQLAPARRVLVGRRDGGDDRVGDGPGAVAGERHAPRATEHDPDVDPATGDRRDPDIAVGQEPHPRVAGASGAGSGR